MDLPRAVARAVSTGTLGSVGFCAALSTVASAQTAPSGAAVHARMAIHAAPDAARSSAAKGGGAPAAAPSTSAHYVSFGFAPGERVPEAKLTDLDGKPGTLATLGGTRGAVIVVRDAECPVSQRYAPRLAELEKEFGPKGFRFVYLDVTPHTAAESRADAAKYSLTGRTVLDADKRLVGALRATSSAEAFVVDRRGTLRYRGAVDDQYGIGVHRDAVTKPWLRDAVDHVIAGKELAVASTDAPGCMFDADLAAAGTPRPVTYHNRISRLIQMKCEGCHNAAGMAPMPLQSYRQVYDRRAVISYMAKSRRMPPWSANPKIGHWTNDASLSPRELQDLLSWAKNGAPEGVASQAPLPKSYVKGWNIGQPDAIVQITDTFRVPAQGVVEYKYFYVQTHFDTDRWITAMEIRPTAPKNVHHVLVFLEEPGRKDAGDRTRKQGEPPAQGGIDGFFAATAPGTPATIFPLGAAKKLPKGAWLKFQIHYTPNGTPATDQTRLGFVFADDSARAQSSFVEVQSRSAFNSRFEIPPGAPNHEVVATYNVRRGGTLISLFPHMHLRGKAFKFELVAPDSSSTVLLDVPRYDFTWQTYYRFREPVRVEPGMKIRATAWFDNSKNNPFNPDPTKAVHFGEQTFDEMMIGYFDWIPDPAPPVVPKPDSVKASSVSSTGATAAPDASAQHPRR